MLASYFLSIFTNYLYDVTSKNKKLHCGQQKQLKEVAQTNRIMGDQKQSYKLCWVPQNGSKLRIIVYDSFNLLKGSNNRYWHCIKANKGLEGV
jgi:hypothetical protein